MKKIQYIIIGIGLVLVSITTSAQTVYTVTKTTDPDPYEHPYNFDDELCDPEMFGTLQWAIRKVNETYGPRVINFNIPGTGQHTILLNNYLPQITKDVVIDGTSQPGYTGDNPVITIDGQDLMAWCFNVYGLNSLGISGFNFIGFVKSGITLSECHNAIIKSNSIALKNSNYNIQTKMHFARISVYKCENISFYNNTLNTTFENIPTPGPYNYGILLTKTTNCNIGSTEQNFANKIVDCYNALYLDSSQNIRISANEIFDNVNGILLEYGSNNSKKKPMILSYEEGIIRGVAEIGDIIEVFGGTGGENANEFLGTVQANENGNWSLTATTSYDYLIATATDQNNNTSMYSDEILVSPTCAKPTNLSATEGISTSHTLTWDCPTGVTYNVAVGVKDLNPLDDNWIVSYNANITDNQITITGLDENTEYEFYVNANCGTEISHWAGPVEFNPTIPVQSGATCEEAIPITADTNLFYSDYTMIGDEMWFKFTALADTCNVFIIPNISSQNHITDISFFDGTCENMVLLSNSTYSDSLVLWMTNLIEGHVYFIKANNQNEDSIYFTIGLYFRKNAVKSNCPPCPNLIRNGDFSSITVPPHPEHPFHPNYDDVCGWSAAYGTPNILSDGSIYIWSCYDNPSISNDMVISEGIFTNVNICENQEYNLSVRLKGHPNEQIKLFLTNGTSLFVPGGPDEPFGATACPASLPNSQDLSFIPINSTGIQQKDTSFIADGDYNTLVIYLYNPNTTNFWAIVSAQIYSIDLRFEINAGDNQSMCLGDPPIQLEVVSCPSNEFIWSPADGLNNTNIPNPVAQPDQTTTYNIDVTDQNGCSVTDDITIFVNEPPDATINPINPVCVDSQILYLTSETVGGTWFGDGITDPYLGEFNPFIAGVGEHEITYTVENECGIAIDSYIVSVLPEIEISVTINNSTCFDTNNGSATVNNISGIPPLTYSWSPSGEITQTAYYLHAGLNTVLVMDAYGCTTYENVFIETTNIDIDISIDNQFFCIGEEESATLTAIASGGIEPYSYIWDNYLGTGDTHTVSPNVTTTYSVIVTDAIGCTETAEITVTVIDLDLIIKDPSPSICIGESIELDAAAEGDNVTYSWSPTASLDNPNSQFPIATPTETTLYTVTATDINGCSITGTVLVTVFPLPIITVSYPAETCAGYAEQLEAFGAITYLWEPATGLSDPTISNPIAILSETTTYVVSGWDEHGCKGFTEITINVLDNPVPIIDYDDPVCLDGNLEINITNIDANSHYLWEGPDGFTTDHPNIVINNVTILNQGLYSVTVTHENGCSASNSIFVTVHSFTAHMGSNHPCVGEDLELVARPDGMVSYHWEGENNLNETTDINQLIIPNADLSMAGTYYVTITDQYGCTASAQTTVVVHENPIVNLGDDILICLSESVLLGQNLTITGGSPSYSYEWEPIDWLSDPLVANPTATPETTTTYTLTVSDIYACTGSDAITITVDQIIGLIATYNEPVCQYTQLQLFAQPDGLEYQWTGPAGFTSTEQNPIVTDVANINYSGTYTLTATNANTCISSVGLDVVVQPVPDVFTGAPQTICEGDELTLQGGPNGMQEYHWIGPIGFVSNLQNPTVSITANTNMQGNYTLTTISEFGCSASATTFVEVIPTPQNAQFALPCVYIFNEYTFTNLGNNDPSFIYSWDFGDGIVSSDANPIHEFQNEGYHCLTLTVSNQCGISTYSPEPIFLYPNECACITQYNAEYVPITGSNEFWNSALSPVKKDIIIESGAKLTVDGQTIQFGPEGRVIVKQGGELFITNFSTLRGLESCENMWQGVEVWGDYDSQATDVVQGKVIIGKQDNIIQDAHIGILVGARNMDNLCEFNIEQAFINEFAGGFVFNMEKFYLINNGIGIKVLRKHNSAMATWDNQGLTSTQFLSEDGGLNDYNYNSVLGPDPYPNIHNQWAGKANSLQRTDVGIWMDNVKTTNFFNCKFANLQYGILAYNSYFNVIRTNFDNAVYGIRIENLNSGINSGHEINGCNFTNIKGIGDDDFEDITSAGIFINSSLNAKIHGNVFGHPDSEQYDNNRGIFTLNSLSLNVYQNEFNHLENGIFTANLIFGPGFQPLTNLPTNYIGAGINTTNDVTQYTANWQGNNFKECKTSIYTYLINSNLKLKCNICNNSESDGEYFSNFYNEGLMANIGAAPISLSLPWINVKRAAGNEFTPDNVSFNGYYKTIWTNTAYEYFAHAGPLKVIPKSHSSSPTNMTSHIYPSNVQKPTNHITACAPASIIVGPVLPNVEVLPSLGFANVPYKKLDEYKASIDSLNYIADNIKQNIDGGNTLQLLNAIYGNMANGRLQNLLIENSPLSDTVIYALLTEYPLSHGNFKNVMQINLPVSKEYAQLFFDVMEQIPAGIANQLITLQGANPGINTISSIQRETEYLWLERGQLLNNLLNMLTDSINNNRDDALLILEKENSLWANATLAASYFEDGDYLASREKISVLQSDDPLVNDFIDYQNLMLEVYEDGRSIYQLDSTEISFIRNLAYKCPAGVASFNCQAILSQLYRENVPICPVTLETRMNTIPEVNYLQTENYNRVENEISLGENYPDPASDYTNITYFLPEEKVAVFVVYDAVGKLIYKSDANIGENQLTLDTRNLLPGIYTYSLSTNDGETITKKMIVYR